MSDSTSIQNNIEDDSVPDNENTLLVKTNIRFSVGSKISKESNTFIGPRQEATLTLAKDRARYELK